MPIWEHRYWQEFTPSIPMALTPAEIQKCHEFHSQLNELSRVHGISHTVQGNWHMCMEQTIAKQLKNPLSSGLTVTQ